MSRVLNVILSHQPKSELERVLDWWSDYAAAEDTLVAYGGTESEFARLGQIPRVFVADANLRVRDQQREKQSWGGILRAAAQWLAQTGHESFTHVYLAEFDHLPIVKDLAARLTARADEERADVLAHHLHRVDGTSNLHYLYHLADPAFLGFWQRISVRSEKETVLKFVITGSFWTRDAFVKVAAQEEEISAYVEIYVPTLAHHLGYRMKGFREQDRCVSTMPIEGLSVEKARAQGCWTMHPVKTLSARSRG